MGIGALMKRKLYVETWDGKSKILAELDVIQELSKDKIIINVYSNIYKELTYQPEEDWWKVTKEDIDESIINKRAT